MPPTPLAPLHAPRAPGYQRRACSCVCTASTTPRSTASSASPATLQQSVLSQLLCFLKFYREMIRYTNDRNAEYGASAAQSQAAAFDYVRRVPPCRTASCNCQSSAPSLGRGAPAVAGALVLEFEPVFRLLLAASSPSRPGRRVHDGAAARGTRSNTVSDPHIGLPLCSTVSPSTPLRPVARHRTRRALRRPPHCR